MSRIQFNDYNEEIKSLRFQMADGRDATTGVVLKGRPHGADPTDTETITVTFGCLRINGTMLSEGQTTTIAAGTHIDLEAITESASYLCVYGDFKPMDQTQVLVMLESNIGKLVRVTAENFGTPQHGVLEYRTGAEAFCVRRKDSVGAAGAVSSITLIESLE